MSGWLILWLSLAAFAPAGVIAAVLYDRLRSDRDGYEALGVFMIILVMFAVSAVGIIGTLGWFIAWGVGS